MAAAGGVVVGTSATGSAAAASGKSDLAAVRAATAKYHDVAVAEADGYLAAADAAPWGAETLRHRFQGPMAGHGPGMPEYYDLHVWLWKHNPAGMTAQYNHRGDVRRRCAPATSGARPCRMPSAPDTSATPPPRPAVASLHR